VGLPINPDKYIQEVLTRQQISARVFQRRLRMQRRKKASLSNLSDVCDVYFAKMTIGLKGA